VLDFYRTLATELAQQPVVMATVTMTRGSVPREVGAKMIVCADGRIVGTIGGGAGEAKVYAKALETLRSGNKTFVDIDLSGIPQDSQGVCGGKMTVWVERWQSSSLPLIEAIITALQQDSTAVIITPFEPSRSPYLSHDPNDAVAGIQVTADRFIEPLSSLPLLVIIGAGHVAVPLAQVADLIGFRVVVVDDRPEFANAERFPQAEQVLAQPTPVALATIPATTPLYAALVTRGLQHDLDALAVLLQRPTHYIGMIGSQKRVQLVIQTLLQQGGDTAKIHHLYAPIGLDIGALTPAEIAISIGAELIKVRRGGTGKSLSRLQELPSTKN
jgi:xanthine dehydrogenase accessory factor